MLHFTRMVELPMRMSSVVGGGYGKKLGNSSRMLHQASRKKMNMIQSWKSTCLTAEQNSPPYSTAKFTQEKYFTFISQKMQNHSV